jgi:hypothetical protein
MFQMPRLAGVLDRIVLLVQEAGEVDGYELSRTTSAWRDDGKRLWILDKARDRGIDFRVDGFASTGRPIITMYRRETHG